MLGGHRVGTTHHRKKNVSRFRAGLRSGAAQEQETLTPSRCRCVQTCADSGVCVCMLRMIPGEGPGAGETRKTWEYLLELQSRLSADAETPSRPWDLSLRGWSRCQTQTWTRRDTGQFVMPTLGRLSLEEAAFLRVTSDGGAPRPTFCPRSLSGLGQGQTSY